MKYNTRHHNTAWRNRTGFSLVELSIVLVILGLLVGGILGGQSLIRAAELRNVTAEYQQLQTAVYTFRQKYHAVPGDMPNATMFWGLARAGTRGCQDWDATNEPLDPAGGTATCNGDGNGNLTSSINSYAVTEGQRVEQEPLFWSHLTNAGLIINPYNSYPRVATVGMWSRVSGAAWQVGKALWSPYIDALWFASGTPPAEITLENLNSVYEGMATLSTEEAWNIDRKIDDGKPFSGKVTTAPGFLHVFDMLHNCTTMPDGGVVRVNMDEGNYLTYQTGAKTYVYPDHTKYTDVEYRLGHSGKVCFIFMAL